ncbi:MAG: putative reductase [Candidatus Saccharibacteria bacterium]|nr:putative reductase [Candidatus Saccharibacteria bacterium]
MGQGHTLNNGLVIPAIGFGTWQILLNGKAKNAVAEALKAGYRLIDTAKIYGNEKGVGQAIRESGIPREEIFLTTKLWNSDQGYDSAIDAFDDSLARLGFSYIDLYLIHWPATERRHDAWRALQDIYKVGRAKAIGVSNYMVEHLEEVLGESEVVPAVNQIEFHPFVYRRQQPILAFCKAHNIVVEAYSPLARGSHLNHPSITEVAKKVGKSNAQVMLRWAIQHDTIPIPKSTNPDRIRENLAVFDFELAKEDMQRLNNL